MNTAVHDDATSARRVDRLVAHYATSHRNPVNEVIHFIAVPLIMLSLLGMIYAIHPWAAFVFLALSLIYYVQIGSVVVLAFMVAWVALLLAAVYAMGRHVLPVSVAVFFGAWIAQFIGHKIEGAKPSFFEDLQYLLVGPVFVLTKLLDRMGVRW